MAIETTGTVDFKYGSETFQTWYRILGDLKNSEHRPLVIVHGGPGMTHHYMLFVLIFFGDHVFFVERCLSLQAS